ncbi:DUF2793 domain-containing protein [Aureimonas psammosilenae]|uniref:DUF2793 domain-containing protein n=1 Tax=Aureimonas psammosilenae TaxID=2495496 RepID=UPI0012609BEA|nr:DUF2793 domain-containing protein [Aureimonas psammosilenae]
MSDRTDRLSLPLLMPSQAQKHLTHNEALMALDALVQLAVTKRASAPPADAVQGERILVAAPASGAFTGREGRIAVRDDEGWLFLVPHAGWLLWLAAEGVPLVHDGAAWGPLKVRRTDRLGIGAEAGETDRLAVSSPAVLFDHAGTDSRVKINKAASVDTASLLFQRDYSGRAEIGLSGSEDLSLKVSADGAAWKEALRVAGSTGHVGLGKAASAARLDVAGAVRVGQYAKAALPVAGALGAGALVFVSDDAGGPVLAFSDGAAWRRVTDRATIS